MRYRLVLHRANLAANDTDYTLVIPEGATDVRVALTDGTLVWRYDTASVSTTGSGMRVAAGLPAELARGPTQMIKTTLHVAVSSGAGVALFAVMSCLVPLTR